uniref:Uncharacterized protein n=1 Tax=Lepeophtheirus salmonis TaxID=72036 RepID=A0A0K2VFF0_LEPSM
MENVICKFDTNLLDGCWIECLERKLVSMFHFKGEF